MISSKSVIIVLMLITATLAETAVQFVQVHDNGTDHESGRQTTTVVTNSRWWPYGWGWGWGWGIAIFVLAIVKGSILLGLFVIWAFFHAFGKRKGGCAPIIIRESSPPYFDHPPSYAPWDRNSPPEEIIRSKRSAAHQDYHDSELYWTDLITDIGFSFLGVHSKDCRKRFVCEVDVRSRNDPWMKFATRMFGVDIFRKYRSSDDKEVKSIEECSTQYKKCKHSSPSISFAMISGHIDPLADYDEGLLNGGETTEETTIEDNTVTEPVTTTTQTPQKKLFNKRKRFFKVDKI